MLYDIIMSISFNICLLVVLAMLLTRSRTAKKILLNQEGESGNERLTASRQRLVNHALLGILFGVFCIISDYIGIQVKGALPNARVLGVLSAGMLGGPISGMTTAVIAAIHRHLIFPERISTSACVTSAIIHGIMGSAIGYYKKEDFRYSNGFLLGLTLFAEFLHMLLILIMTKPYGGAVEIVKLVILPMIIINSVGMVIFFNVFKNVFRREDLEIAEKVSLTLRTAERSIPLLMKFHEEGSFQKIIDIIIEEYGCEGAAVVKDGVYLGCSRVFCGLTVSTKYIPEVLRKPLLLGVAESKNSGVIEDPFYPLYEKNVVLAAGIQFTEEEMGCLVMAIRKNAYSSRADLEFISGLASYYSTQLKLLEMENQKELLRKAEIQTLQSQINPHFLFNALNTISCFCREKPEKARELLMALSYYFRNMLEDVDYMVTLDMEIEHVRAYILLEEARFEERLTIEIAAREEDCNCRVPNLILQPIVENAIRHGAMQREWGTVKIEVIKGVGVTSIDVTDNGPGINQEIINSLHGAEKKHGGIGLQNVQQRLVNIYGRDCGLEIETGKTGTRIRMNIPNQEEKMYEDNRS